MIELGKELPLDVPRFERISVLAEAKRLEPVPYIFHEGDLTKAHGSEPALMIPATAHGYLYSKNPVRERSLSGS